MFVKKKTIPIKCLNFKHLFVLAISSLVGAEVLCQEGTFLFYHEPVTKNRSASRGPANFVPDDQIEPLPLENKSWTQQILVDDDAGVLEGIRRDMQKWEETENYVKAWNLESTRVYDTPSTDKKRAYLQRMLLKYADKRLSGEVKKAEEGSALHSVGQAQKALKPNAEAAISQNIKVKFKARLLQGKAIMLVKNPYFDYETTANLEGEVNLDAKKEFKDFGVRTSANYRADEDKLRLNIGKKFEELQIQANLDYEVSDESWTASLQRPIYKKLVGRVASTQSEKEMILGNESNQVMEVMFNTSF